MGQLTSKTHEAGRSLAAIFLIIAVLAACGPSEQLSDVPPTPPEQASKSRVPDAAAEGNLKEMGKGLYLKEVLPPPGMEFIDHVVITGDWTEFEPRDQEFTGPGWTRLAEMLDHPEIKVRLRIQAGRGAPTFVKMMGGPPVSGDGVDCSEEGGVAIAKKATSTDGLAKAASRGCVPYFWTDPVLEQYEQLMNEVARRYEANPRLLDVVDSACMTFFAEPFIRAGRSGSTNERLFNAGLNERTDEACLRRSAEIHDKAFATTRMSLATHTGWQIVSDPEEARNGVTVSWERQRGLLEDLRSLYGAKLVVQNNGLGGHEGCRRSDEPDGSHFCWLAHAEPPKGFQTEGDNRLTNRGFTVLDAVDRAVAMGACFVEHNQFGDDARKAEDYDRRLKENC